MYINASKVMTIMIILTIGLTYKYRKLIDSRWLHTEAVELEAPITVALEQNFNYKLVLAQHNADTTCFLRCIANAIRSFFTQGLQETTLGKN